MEVLGLLVAASFVLGPVVLPVATVIALVFWTRRAERRRIETAKASLAEAWGLVEVPEARDDHRAWIGARRGQPLHLAWCTDARGEDWTELRVGAGLDPAWVIDTTPGRAARSLAADELATWIDPPEAGPPLTVGDPAFEGYRVGGPAGRALAVLGHDRTRDEVAGWMSGGGDGLTGVRGGALVVRLPGTETDPADLAPLLRRAIALAGRLEVEEDAVTPRLASHARSSPIDGVRRACLHALIDRQPTAERVEPFLHVSDPRMRLAAADHLGATEVLIDVVEDRALDPDLAVRALHRLEAHPVAAPPAVAAALERTEPQILAAAARLAGVAGAEETVPSLVRLLDGPLRGWGEGEGWRAIRPVAVALAEALGHLGGPEAELVLIALLDAPSNEVRIEAMRSLGAVGTVTAVQPILAHAERPFPAVREAAREAVAAIQDRVEHGGAGALSLSGGPEGAGALSIAPDAGGVTLADDPDRNPTPEDDQSTSA